MNGFMSSWPFWEINVNYILVLFLNLTGFKGNFRGLKIFLKFHLPDFPAFKVL